jgi:hypothetical protein
MKNQGSTPARPATARIQPVEKAFTVKVFDRRDPGRVGLRLQIAPLHELTQSLLNLFECWWLTRPSSRGMHLIGAQMQAELPLGGREQIQDCAVQRRIVSHYMAKKGGRRTR